MRHAVSSASMGSSEKKNNVRGAKLTQKRTRGTPCSFKCKQGLQGRKRQGRQINGEKDERAAMQFQVQTKGQQGRHAVSSASRGSREENVRGAKLRKGREGRHAESMQFQVQAGAPGKKTSGAPN